MNALIVTLIIFTVLFIGAFLTKRRFGVLGFALAAGAVLSELWASTLTPFVQKSGFVISAPPMESVVAAVLILLPAVLLLFSGPVYRTFVQRMIGAVAFALLAVAFLLESLGDALVLQADSRQIFAILLDNQAYIITAGIVFALFDLLTAKTPKAKKE